MPNLTTIEYDQPITNLIAGLNATGHITHGPYKKTGVTFHHNGGIFTHQEILNIWKTRPASAHFDVDANGAVAQFANAYDYAWACANTKGNECTISIEMCNATLAPKWLVSETTWRSAARLAGWLFAHIIDAEPTEHNIYFHHDWYPTACAGPYMDSVRSELVDAVQAAYRLFKDGKTPNPPAPTPPARPVKPAKLTVDGSLGPATITALEAACGTTQDGHLSAPSLCVSHLQTWLNKHGHRDRTGQKLKVDGLGIQENYDQSYGPTHTVEALQGFLGTKVDGVLSKGDSLCIRALQKYLNSGKKF